MKNDTPQKNTYTDSIRLSDEERLVMRQRLLSYMEFHPREATLPAASEAGWKTWIPRVPARVFAGAFGVMLMVATPVFAENSMPGDMLYPVKVRFNEELRATFASSSQEKIAWEVERMERRLAEARYLANEGRLTAEAEGVIAATLREHAEEAVKELALLRESDGEDAAVVHAAFESALEVQSSVLETTATQPKGDIAATVNELRIEAATEAARPEAKDVSYERLAAFVSGELARSKELLETIAPAVSPEDSEGLESRIADAEYMLTTAAELAADDHPESATALVRGALSNAQKLMVFMRDIDVRGAVALERLVPRPASLEEQLVATEDALTELGGQYLAISEGFATLETDTALLMREEFNALTELMQHFEDLSVEDIAKEEGQALSDARLLAARLEIFLAEHEQNPETEPAGE